MLSPGGPTATDDGGGSVFEHFRVHREIVSHDSTEEGFIHGHRRRRAESEDESTEKSEISSGARSRGEENRRGKVEREIKKRRDRGTAEN